MDPYHRNAEGNPIFAKSWVLFLDVLGASEMAGSADAENRLAALDKAVARGRGITTDALADPWFLASWFSDNLAIGSPIKPGLGQGEPELVTFLHVIGTAQLTLALEGFFTRGGLTLGHLFMDENISFGPALVEAVSIERSARYPRVLLGTTAMELVREHLGFYGNQPEVAPHNTYLWVDQHGDVFVNYLNAIGNYVGEEMREAKELVDTHRNQVAENLASHRDEPHVWQKYAWLATYHNAFCAMHDLNDCIIPPLLTGNAFYGFGEGHSN
jgi:hypothetical protein